MEASIQRGIKFYNTKRYQQALEEFRAMDEDPSENSELAYYIGLTLTQLGRYDEGLLYLEQVVNSHTSFLHIYQSRMILGYIYSVTGRYKLAEFEFKKLIDLGMESIQIYASLGYIYYGLKRVEDGVQMLSKALELDPDYPNALNSLGYIFAEEDIDHKKALDYCKRAVQSKPNNPAYLDSLGWAYYKNGEFEEARTNLRKALDLASGNREIARHLKKVIAEMSEPQE
jgi:tetratricopeptide (TPR) repeat protein